MSRKLTKTEKLSRRIARAIFTNAYGKRADMIQLCGPKSQYPPVIGAWAECSVAWEVEKHIKKALRRRT